METLRLKEISGFLKGRARTQTQDVRHPQTMATLQDHPNWRQCLLHIWRSLGSSVEPTLSWCVLHWGGPLPAWAPANPGKGSARTALGKQSWLNIAVFINWSLETSPAQGKIWSLITVGIGPAAPSPIDCSSCFLSGLNWFSEAGGWA